MDNAKKIVAKKAVEFIHENMIVGLGTGSTVHFFLEALGLLCQRGLNIKAVASSDATTELALKWQIPLLEWNKVDTIDVTIDGADEVDSKNRLIKGGGGALLREKIVASSSKEMIVIVDETKISKTLGSKKLPIEIVQFCYPATIRKINALGFEGSLRKKPDGSLYFTDSGNHIYDVHFKKHSEDPAVDHANIIQIPGVVETGLFTDLAMKILIGFQDGRIEQR